MGAVKKDKPTHVLALIAKHTKTSKPAPAKPVIPATSLWAKIRGRRS